jgi:hypothetical protein
MRKSGNGSSSHYLHLLLREFHSSGEDWNDPYSEPMQKKNQNKANVCFQSVKRAIPVMKTNGHHPHRNPCFYSSQEIYIVQKDGEKHGSEK